MSILLTLLACASAPATTKSDKAAALVTEAAEQAAEPAVVADAQGWKHYGGEFVVDTVTPAATLLADPASFEGQTLRVEGSIGDVCQSAGCWMVLADGDKSMRVMMKDHAFSVDKDISGQSCQVEGVVTVRELDPEFVEHLASESDNPDEMPEKDAVDGRIYEFEAYAASSRAP